ncbi:MAG: D-alanine--D-alanine ligase [Candidatus Omnitrophota bacterium]|nr:D-alanine--D-alanine ligase [Candidatus Omnitrophota bacterium]
MKKDYGRIGVLMGGPSAEREVSIRSGKAILEALLSKGYDARPVELGMPTKEELKSLGIDTAFIALHGTFGEDGQIQTMLEELNIPYTGSKVKASRLGMDKVASRKLFEKNRLFVPRYEVLTNGTRPALEFGKQIVVKPSAQGSSVGVTIAEKQKELEEAIDKAFGFGDAVILEEFIEGKELTVGILDDKPLPVIQLVPKRRFYDEVAKYTSGMTEYLVPAPISKMESDMAQDAAIRAHKCLGCASISRVDMILSREERIIVLEVNTIPGMTQLSLLPKAASAAGMGFAELCERMLRSADRDGEKT